jgi:hypothetical protein
LRTSAIVFPSTNVSWTRRENTLSWAHRVDVLLVRRPRHDEYPLGRGVELQRQLQRFHICGADPDHGDAGLARRSRSPGTAIPANAIGTSGNSSFRCSSTN